MQYVRNINIRYDMQIDNPLAAQVLQVIKNILVLQSMNITTSANKTFALSSLQLNVSHNGRHYIHSLYVTKLELECRNKNIYHKIFFISFIY